MESPAVGDLCLPSDGEIAGAAVTSLLRLLTGSLTRGLGGGTQGLHGL